MMFYPRPEEMEIVVSGKASMRVSVPQKTFGVEHPSYKRNT